jgi:septal ring factor EnvC (AmiA/AmiB activator)
MIHVDLEEEVAHLRQEKEQLNQELAGALESGRQVGEELGRKDRELSGNTRRLVICRLSPLCFF